MHDLIIFALGAAFVVVLIFAIACLESWDFRRAYWPTTRPGYLDLTVLSSSYEGRNASADSDSDELSGGPSSRPPTHLRVVRGGDESPSP